MVDGKNLSAVVRYYLKDLSYENMVKIYDGNCDGCPFALIKINKVKRTYKECKSISEAIHVLLNLTNAGNMDYSLFRGCQYNDQVLTLREIVTNSCRFWKTETCEGGNNELEPSFIEVIEVKEMHVVFPSF